VRRACPMHPLFFARVRGTRQAQSECAEKRHNDVYNRSGQVLAL
jgi:hypothetical protein